jgi:hypothetical protein
MMLTCGHSTGFYYDAQSGYYYNATTGYSYHPTTQSYYSFDSATQALVVVPAEVALAALPLAAVTVEGASTAAAAAPTADAGATGQPVPTAQYSTLAYAAAHPLVSITN